jgi:putative lipoic acid-binding regulatory protein
MSDPVFGDARLEFPVQVHYRILCEASDRVAAAVTQCARDLGVSDGFADGRQSQGGKYRSFQLSVVVESAERMHAIDAAFRAVPGVKMVL